MIDIGIVFNGIKKNTISDSKTNFSRWVFFFKATTEGAAETKSPTPPIKPRKIDLGFSHIWGIPSHLLNTTGIIIRF